MGSNFVFGLLGYALARRADTSYEPLIPTEVTGPLKLKNTAVTLTPDQEQRMISGYNSRMEAIAGNAWSYRFFVGAGVLKPTAPDLLGLSRSQSPSIKDWQGGAAG